MHREKTTDKREDERNDLDLPVRVSIDGDGFHCVIKNYSRRGVLLCLDNSAQDALSHDMIGNEICFDGNGELPGGFSSRGRIVRFLDDGESVYMAVCFI